MDPAILTTLAKSAHEVAALTSAKKPSALFEKLKEAAETAKARSPEPPGGMTDSPDTAGAALETAPLPATTESAAPSDPGAPGMPAAPNPPAVQPEVVPPPPNDDVLDTLDHVIEALKTGREITGLRERIAQLITNQESRAELISNLTLTHDFDRLKRYLRARAALEDMMLRAVTEQSLSPVDVLEFLNVIQEQSEKILNRVQSSATNIQDLTALLNKADYAVQTHDAELAKKFSNTSPQGREIIRRLAHRLYKLSAESEG
jgi:hypothetical protein